MGARSAPLAGRRRSAARVRALRRHEGVRCGQSRGQRLAGHRRGLADLPHRSERSRQVDATRVHLGIPRRWTRGACVSRGGTSRGGRRTAGRSRGSRPSSRRRVRSASSTCSTTRLSARTFARDPASSRACCGRPGSGVSRSGCGEEARRALEIVGLDGRASDPAAVLPLGTAPAPGDRARPRAAAVAAPARRARRGAARGGEGAT